jgi:hypothetical protein
VRAGLEGGGEGLDEGGNGVMRGGGARESNKKGGWSQREKRKMEQKLESDQGEEGLEQRGLNEESWSRGWS